MKEFLRVIGWKKSNGRWDTFEIFVDVLVFGGLAFLAVTGYTVWGMYNA